MYSFNKLISNGSEFVISVAHRMDTAVCLGFTVVHYNHSQSLVHLNISSSTPLMCVVPLLQDTFTHTSHKTPVSTVMIPPRHLPPYKQVIQHLSTISLTKKVTNGLSYYLKRLTISWHCTLLKE